MPDVKALIGKLNGVCRRAVENAAERSLQQTNFKVEIEHVLLELIKEPGSDFARVMRSYDIDSTALTDELRRAIDRLERGNTRLPALSPQLVQALSAAWSISSLDLGEKFIRSGTITQAIFDGAEQRTLLVSATPLLGRVPERRLVEDLPDLLRGGIENEPETTPLPSPPETTPGRKEDKPSATPALDAYTLDLTAEAAAGRIDPVVGREVEIRQVIDVLMRRRQNNPILAGDAGVGKTSIIEGFAQRIVAGRVPPPLADVAVHVLDLGQLQAGAGVRGEFEHRLRSVINEVTASPSPIVLFIDEAHTLIGAGGQAGQGDAANLLKPALARGTLRTIAATTWSEYKRYVEKDPALARRFQVIKVPEPSEAAAIEMLRGLAAKLEDHHNVRILEEAVGEAVRLSHRYITGRQLPDKAISVLDTACARAAIAQTDPPSSLQEIRRRCEGLQDEIDRLAREGKTGFDHDEKIERLSEELERSNEEKIRLETRWHEECSLVDDIHKVENSFAGAADDSSETLKGELEALRLKLASIQEDEALVPVAVDGRVVAEVVSGWTGIPVGRILADGVASARSLKERMAVRIVGQDAALDTICSRIQTFYAQLGEPSKPTGVFLLVGPSGVGKTETAIALAELLFGGMRSLITVNMSEYQEAHSVSTIRGAPPGYVGYGRGGVLTEAVRRNPFSVVLLDEIEKAHPDVLEVFYQVFDRGILEDSEGQLVDFTNTLILLTSNAGSDVLMGLASNRASVDAEVLVEAVRPRLLQQFPAAFLGRLVVVPYRLLGERELSDIARLKLTRIQERFAVTQRAELTYDDALVRAVVGRARQTESGARVIDAILNDSVLPGLSGRILDHMADGGGIGGVHIGFDSRGKIVYEIRS